MSFCRVALLAAPTFFAAVPQVAVADVSIPTCSERMADDGYDPTEAQRHMSDILRLAFSSDGRASSRLTFTVQGPHPSFARILQDSCFQVHSIEHADAGLFSGLFEDRLPIGSHGPWIPAFSHVSFTLDQVVDWQYLMPNRGFTVYGAFWERHLAVARPDETPELAYLASDVLPPNWNPSPLFELVDEGAPLDAQTQPLCQTSPPAISLYDPTPARESFPAVVRNTFGTDGTGPAHLDVSVLLPGTLTPACPSGSIEPMRDIHALGDGLFEGYVVHNSMSHHSHLFGETFTSTADQVWDWQLVTPETEGHHYGAYRVRNFATWAPDGGKVMMQLMPTPIPPDWN